jgi:hypothetical protein
MWDPSVCPRFRIPMVDPLTAPPAISRYVLRPWQAIVLAALAAAGFVAWFFPPAIFDPREWTWLATGDAAQHFLGWHFFRRDAWQWPPGASPMYGMAMGSAIVFSDSIPLLAFLLKPLHAVLPAHFQYTGAWIAFCFVAAAVLAARCGWLATGRASAAFALGLFAILSTVMIARSPGHFALAGHWLIWWALGNERHPRFAAYGAMRVVCICIAALVHAYLLMIVLAIWAAEIARRWWVTRELDAFAALRHVAIVVVSLAATLWLAGYFTVSAIGGGEHYGLYGAPLSALWNPGWPTTFLPAGPQMPGAASLEGSNYLGFGALVLVVIALVMSLARPRDALAALRANWPLIGACVVLALIAITHRVTWYDRVLFELPMPDALRQYFSIFRGSGRLFWLTFYALMLFGVVAICRRLPRAAPAILAICVTLQIVDLGPTLNLMRAILRDQMIVHAGRDLVTMPSPFWDAAAARYRRVLVLPMHHAAPGWVPLGVYAADHDLPINVGYFARANWDVFGPVDAQLTAALRNGTLDRNALYVLNDATLVDGARLGPDDGVGTVDGFRVIAPGWFTQVDACCIVRAQTP